VNKKKRKKTILLSPYLVENFQFIFEALGYNVLLPKTLEKLIDIVIKDNYDIAIEWQRGKNEFLIRNLLIKYNKNKPVLLSLNWNGEKPEDFNHLGYYDYVTFPFNIEDIVFKLDNCDIFNRSSKRVGLLKKIKDKIITVYASLFLLSLVIYFTSSITKFKSPWLGAFCFIMILPAINMWIWQWAEEKKNRKFANKFLGVSIAVSFLIVIYIINIGSLGVIPIVLIFRPR